MSRTFQNIRLFTGLSAGENVAISALARGAGLGDALATAESELAFVGLDGAGQKRADSLAYGARRLASRLPARWPLNLASCCWTSRPPA